MKLSRQQQLNELKTAKDIMNQIKRIYEWMDQFTSREIEFGIGDQRIILSIRRVGEQIEFPNYGHDAPDEEEPATEKHDNLEVIRRMYHQDRSTAQIAEATGLSPKEVLKIIEQEGIFSEAISNLPKSKRIT